MAPGTRNPIIGKPARISVASISFVLWAAVTVPKSVTARSLGKSSIRPAFVLPVGGTHRRNHVAAVTKMEASKESPVATPTPLDASKMKSDASNEIPFNEVELSSVISGLKRAAGDDEASVDWDALENVMLKEYGHLSHKEWKRTGAAAEKVAHILFGEGMGDERNFRSIFLRVVKEGNWDGAKNASLAKGPEEKPWAVLVTGVNGIRKTTSVYADWFRDLLAEAVVAPEGEKAPPASSLPTGNDSFFRQLDHIVSTLAVEQFETLYSTHTDTDDDRVVASYAESKDGIFTRYRTISEIIGVVLLRRAIKSNMNVMVETSGRDVAMFKYVDTFFPDYRKMVLHFTITDVVHAEESVSARMQGEMAAGQLAMAPHNDVHDVIRANAGGPYGPSALRGVQRQSDIVWGQISAGSPEAGGAGKGWFVACIQIEGNTDAGKWRAAPLRNGEVGQWRQFGRKK